MLTHLQVRDFALIEQLIIEPDEGLTIITGETGAGKSILIDAILALLGGRINKDLVRVGQQSCRVEAMFQIDPSLFAPELRESLEMPSGTSSDTPSDTPSGTSSDTPSELLLSREYNISGKSVFRANDRIVTATTARCISAALFDIHGQHDNQLIFEPATHLGLLDRFAGDPVMTAKTIWQKILKTWNHCCDQLAQLGSDPSARIRMMDTLKFQIAEIEAANIKPHEDEQLQEQRRIRQNQEKIVTALSEACALLAADDGSGAISALGDAATKIEYIGRFSEKIGRLRQPLTEAIDLIQSVSADLTDALHRIDLDPNALSRIDERLDVLYRLKNKYGGTIELVLDYHRKAASKMASMIDSEKIAVGLQKEKDLIRKQLIEAGQILHETRIKSAVVLADRICRELSDLGMKSVRFSVRFAELDYSPPYRLEGLDLIEFLIAPNPGEPERPLARIASGGEAARIMLAIKAILAHADRTPILIFDEIDSGVSGRTALRVAEKMHGLASGRQIFCITHLPQIAAMADHHFLIEKYVADEQTHVKMHCLDESGRLQEMARLLSGDAGTGQAQSLAQEMLRSAAVFRQQSSN